MYSNGVNVALARVERSIRAAVSDAADFMRERGRREALLTPINANYSLRVPATIIQ